MGCPNISLLHAMFLGEIITIPSPVTFKQDDELAIEPVKRATSGLIQCVVPNETGVVTLVNDSDTPVKVRKGQIVGQVRSVVSHNEAVTFEC